MDDDKIPAEREKNGVVICNCAQIVGKNRNKLFIYCIEIGL